MGERRTEDIRGRVGVVVAVVVGIVEGAVALEHPERRSIVGSAVVVVDSVAVVEPEPVLELAGTAKGYSPVEERADAVASVDNWRLSVADNCLVVVVEDCCAGAGVGIEIGVELIYTSASGWLGRECSGGRCLDRENCTVRMGLFR